MADHTRQAIADMLARRESYARAELERVIRQHFVWEQHPHESHLDGNRVTITERVRLRCEPVEALRELLAALKAIDYEEGRHEASVQAIGSWALGAADCDEWADRRLFKALQRAETAVSDP